MSALRCVRSSSGLLLAGLARGSESGRRARYLSGATVHTPAVAAAPDPRPTADEAGAGAPPPPAARDQDPSIVRVLGVVRPYVWPAHRPDIQRAVVVAGLLIAGSKIATVSTPLVFKQAIDALANAAPTALGGGGGDAIDASTVAAQTAADAAAVTTAVLADANALAALAALAPAAQGALLLVGAYGGLRVAAIGMQELRNAVFARVAHAASRSLGRALFSRLHAEQASSLHARTPAASLARVVDRATKAAQSLLSVLVLHIAPTALELGLVCALLGTQCGAPFALIAVATVGSYTQFTLAVTARRNELRRRLNSKDNNLHAELADALANRELIALNRGLPLALARYESRLRGLEGANLEVASSLAYLNFGQAAILNAGVAAVTLLAAARCVEGSLTLGDVVLANQLLLGLAGPLNMLGMVYREYTSAVTDMAAALPVLDLVPAAPAAPAAPSAPAASAVRARAADGVASCDVQPAAHAMRALSAAAVREHGVRFEHVCFQYPSLPAEPKHAAAAAATAANAAAAAAPGTAGSAAAAAALGGARPAALRDISFHVPFGATVAIVGSSGSGKSTILRLATALARPSAGRVLVGGVDARELEPAALRGRVATVLQDSSSFFRESVGFNAGYALLAARARREALAADARGERLEDVGGGLSTLSAAERGAVRRAAERAQLDGVLAALPHGLETDAGERGSRLSGGERQRLGLARALTRVGTGADADDAGDDEERALVLLCDEPTSALDALTEARVLAELRASGRAACTIFVTHRLASCAHADEILVLRGGCVAERGTHAQLVALAGGEYARMWRTQMDERGELAPE